MWLRKEGYKRIYCEEGKKVERNDGKMEWKRTEVKERRMHEKGVGKK